MGFLGSLSNYITPTVQAAGGIESGKLQGVIEKIKLDKQAKDDALKTALQTKTMQNLDSEINARENPKGTIFDQDGNAYERLPNGHLRPAQIDAGPVTPAAATGGPSGDIDLGAPPPQGQQGAQAPKAPVAATPKFGPRKPPDPVATAVAIARATKGIPTYADTHPRDKFSFGTTVDADGKPVVLRQNTNTGDVTPTDAAKPQTGGGASGAQVPVADMEQRYSEIAGHANDLAAGKWKMTPAMQMREGLTFGIARGNAAGEKPPIGEQLGATAMDMLHMGQGPDFARYQALMNSTRALGDDVAKVFKGRQNEQAVYREVALAQLTPDDYQNPTVVAQKLSRLRNVIDLAKLSNPAQAGLVENATGSPPPKKKGKPVLSQADYDAGRAKHSDAEIAQHYDLSGVKRK